MSGIASESPAAQQCKAPPVNAWAGPEAPPVCASARLFARCHVRVQRSSRFGVTTAIGEMLDTPDTDPSIERRGQDIADPHHMPRSNHPAAVDAHTASAHEACGSAPRLDDPCMPQPFVDALPVHSAAFSCFQRRARPRPYRFSLALLSSCSLSAASLANGEFGSIGRSRGGRGAKSRSRR
jgi:hypothetical protein